MPSLAGLFFWMNVKLENIKKLDVSKSLKLDCGKTISNFPLAYETYGKLSENKDNAVLVFHALTGDQFVTGTNPITKKDGWWITAVGPGKAIDTNKYFVICANVIGGCMGSLGPHEPMHPPITFAQITKYLFVSIALPGPTAVTHHPSFFVIGFIPLTN